MLKDRGEERQRQAWRVAFAIAAVWTAWASLIPVDALPDVSIWDKLAHALTYALLMWLLLPSLAPPSTVAAGSWVMLYGVAIEVAQALSGYRQGDWQDALANLAGILFAGLCWRLYALARKRRPE
jgi:VanZ family protein